MNQRDWVEQVYAAYIACCARWGFWSDEARHYRQQYLAATRR